MQKVFSSFVFLLFFFIEAFIVQLLWFNASKFSLLFTLHSFLWLLFAFQSFLFLQKEKKISLKFFYWKDFLARIAFSFLYWHFFLEPLWQKMQPLLIKNLPSFFLVKSVFSLLVLCVYIALQTAFSFLPAALWMYLVAGGLTTWVSFYSFALALPYGLFFAQSFSFVLAVVAAFFMQNFFVFSKSTQEKTAQEKPVQEKLSVQGLGSKFLRFVFARSGVSFIFEFLFLFLWQSFLPFSLLWGKGLASLFVLLLNYFLSKYFVFKR